MNRSRLAVLVGALAAVCMLMLAPGAQAIGWCGNEAGGEVLIGSPQLRTELSTTNLDFGSSSDVKVIALTFRLGDNCNLAAAEGIVGIPHSSEKIDDAFGKSDADAWSGHLYVDIPVDGSKIDPGSHSVAIAIRSLTPLIEDTMVKVTIQRKEEPPVPTLITIICALIGIGAAIVVTLENAGKGARFRFVGIATAAVAGFIAAGAVRRAAYVDAEVWKVELESILTLVIGALPAAFGAAVASLKIIVKTKDPQDQPQPRAASPDPDRPGEVGAVTDR